MQSKAPDWLNYLPSLNTEFLEMIKQGLNIHESCDHHWLTEQTGRQVNNSVVEFHEGHLDLYLQDMQTVTLTTSLRGAWVWPLFPNAQKKD